MPSSARSAPGCRQSAATRTNAAGEHRLASIFPSWRRRISPVLVALGSRTPRIGHLVVKQDPDPAGNKLFCERTAFFAWRRGAQASPRKLDSWIRAGERRTCWAKPPLVPPRLWALNGVGSFADASLEHSEQWLEGTDRDSRAFGPASQPGPGRLARGRGPRWLSLHKRPTPT